VSSLLLKTALILDVNNLYFGVQGKFGKRRLQMLEYARSLEKIGHILIHKIAYSRQKPEDAQSFLSILKNNGFECHFGNTQWNVAMALRAADVVPNVDCLVLGSAYHETGRILSWAKEKGKITKCYAVDIPAFFRQFAECIEIGEDVLSEAAAPA